MGLFDAESRRERKLQRMQDDANRYAEEALALWRAGRALDALRPNQRAIDIIGRLRAEEPDNEAHLEQLAGKQYNHAGMLAQAGRLATAVEAARQCLASYLELAGGEVTIEALMADRLLSLGASFRPSPRIDLPRLASMIADAKSRLAALLARHEATRAAEEAKRLAAEAVATYEQIADTDGRYQKDLARVRAEQVRVHLLTGQG